MKINGPPIQIPHAGIAGVPTRAPKSGDVQVSLSVDPSRAHDGGYSGRPVRINRSDEEAALFAYTKQAELNLSLIHI